MSSLALTFDRSDDVSKLEGCNTRGIAYRWNIFSIYLAVLSAGAEVLDFGAGSLRESFDLVQKGFDVTSVDVSAETLDEYRRKYDWPANGRHRVIANLDLFAALDELEDQYALIAAFDVLEHLEDPVAALQELAKHLRDDGLMFVTVPNGLTLFEVAFRTDLMIARATGRELRPGEPHLQWHSPGQWKRLIERSGLFVVDHDMQIGFFANTTAALVQLPLTIGGRIVRKLGIQNDALGLSERIINSRPLARAMDFIDQNTKPLFGGLYGWNLFVLQKVGQSAPINRQISNTSTITSMA